MLEALRQNWRAYLMEAAGLGGFVVGAGLLTILLEHPDFPVMRSFLGEKENAIWRRVPLGVVMGVYVAIVTLLCGDKSGAHINPATTWAFYRLGKIDFTNAVFYTAAQFVGATFAAFSLVWTIGEWFAHPLIKYGVTEPKPEYTATHAFVAEFVISFVLMLTVLIFVYRKSLEKKAAYAVGFLIAVYLIFELPLSGMSLNPARSFAASLAANEWRYLWIYFVAPVAAMLMATEIFVVFRRSFGEFFDAEPLVYPATETAN